MSILSWYKTGGPQPVEDIPKQELQSKYRSAQWQVWWSLFIGYAFFYTCRLSLSVAKKPLLDEGIVTVEELGLIGSALYFAYAFGKLTNGFLADHANVRKLMSTGLFVSALINIVFGATQNATVFAVLWGLNGWFQSMGSAPSGVLIFQWFEPSRRGRFYSSWAGSHNIGEGITFVVTANLVAVWGWRAGFIAPGIMCVIVAIGLYWFLYDRPVAEGLPAPAVMFDEPDQVVPAKPSFKSQLSVLKMPVVWQLGIACALMYVARYAINSWGILFLQEAKDYSLVDASLVIGVYPLLGFIGSVLCGVISDKYFNSERNVPTFYFGLLNIGGMALLFYGPGGVWDYVAMGVFGFGIGGLIVFLAGLTAAEYCPRDAVGAAIAIIGLFSYLAASAQEYISALLIDEVVLGEVTTYDFSRAITFWMAAGVLSLIVAYSVKITQGHKPVS